MSNWSAKSALTTRELECLNNLSSLFHLQPPQILEEDKEEAPKL